MNITFLVTKQSMPHEGAVRPFLNFLKGMKGKETSGVALFKCGPKLVNYVDKLDITSYVLSNESELIKEKDLLHTDFIICDDSFLDSRILSSLKKKIRAKIVVYVQVLYGIHAISSCFDLGYLPFKEKAIFSLLKFINFCNY